MAPSPTNSATSATRTPTRQGSPDKAATQARILSAATDLFLRRGYSRTSVTQIANKAGVSRAAVFWHFGDKQKLFRAAAKQFVVPFREALGGRLTHLEPRKRLFELIDVYEQFVEANRPNIELFVNWVLESPEHAGPIREELLGLHDLFRAEVESALVELLKDEPLAAVYSNGVISLLDGNLLLGIFGSGPRARSRHRSGLRAMVELVLASEPGAPKTD